MEESFDKHFKEITDLIKKELYARDIIPEDCKITRLIKEEEGILKFFRFEFRIPK